MARVLARVLAMTIRESASQITMVMARVIAMTKLQNSPIPVNS